MKDVIFLQFYSTIARTSFLEGATDLGNGFSDTYDLCRSHGDFYWLKYDSFLNWQKDGYFDIPLPIKKGTVYISAIYVNHLIQSYHWAERYPEIDFIVGGPVTTFPFQLKEDLPPNLLLTGKSVEEWFGVPDFSGDWRLDAPPGISGPCSYSFTLDNHCYWSKCSFCVRPNSFTQTIRNRSQLDFECSGIPYPAKKQIHLNTESITPKMIREIIPRLPYNEDVDLYSILLRPAQAEREALKAVLTDDCRLRFILGIEFPSERMWKRMKKGFNRADVIDTITILAGHGIKTQINFINGWPDLCDQDLIELEEFMNLLPRRGRLDIAVGRLFAYHDTEIYRVLSPGRRVTYGPFDFGFSPTLTREQRLTNARAREIIYAGSEPFNLLKLFGKN